MVIVEEPINEIEGGVVSDTTTVLVTSTAALPERSLTL